MIGLDTNVVVRFLVQDDPDQSAEATALMERLSPDRPGYLTTVVVIETYWVLTRAYGNNAAAVVDALRQLVDNASIATQDHVVVTRALELAAANGADLPDALIAEACRASGCSAVASFDRGAGKILGFRTPTRIHG